MKRKEELKPYKVFISYSLNDKNFVSELIRLLEFMGLDVDKDFILSSKESFRGDEFANFFEYFLLQHESYNIFVLFVNSPYYYRSNICQNELGIAWTLKSGYFSLFVKGFEFQQITNPIFSEKNSVNVGLPGAEQGMSSLRNMISHVFGKGSVSDSLWEERCSDFLRKVNSLPEYQKTVTELNLEADAKYRLFDTVYLPIFSEIFRLLDISNYSEWMYHWACSGSPIISETRYQELHNLDAYLNHVTQNPEFPELNGLLTNLSLLVHDYVVVMDLHALKDTGGNYTIDHFYMGLPNNPCFDTDFHEYTEYCFLLNDLTLELTRMLNLLLDNVRIKCPGYLSDIPYISIDRKKKEDVQYRFYEKSDTPYPGLGNFLMVRASRSKYFGNETDLEFFNL